MLAETNFHRQAVFLPDTEERSVMQDLNLKDRLTDMGQFPGHKSEPTRPQDRVDSVRNSFPLKLIRDDWHSDGHRRQPAFASQP
jgi:hypothetical protein